MALLAQWIEHLPPEQGVARSNRAERAIEFPPFLLVSSIKAGFSFTTPLLPPFTTLFV